MINFYLASDKYSIPFKGIEYLPFETLPFLAWRHIILLIFSIFGLRLLHEIRNIKDKSLSRNSLMFFKIFTVWSTTIHDQAPCAYSFSELTLHHPPPFSRISHVDSSKSIWPGNCPHNSDANWTAQCQRFLSKMPREQTLDAVVRTTNRR